MGQNSNGTLLVKILMAKGSNIDLQGQRGNQYQRMISEQSGALKLSDREVILRQGKIQALAQTKRFHCTQDAKQRQQTQWQVKAEYVFGVM